MKKLVLALALAATALAPVAPLAAQVSLNLNQPQPDTPNSGTLAAGTVGAAYTVPLGAGQNVAAFSMAGLTASGATVVVEGTVDGTTWTGVNSSTGATGVLVQSFTADGAFSVNIAGRTAVRLRVSVAGTGNIAVASNTSAAVRDLGIDKPLPPGPNKIGGVTMADGDHATMGAKADAAVTDPTLAASEIAILKGQVAWLKSVAGYTKPVTSVVAAAVGTTVTPGIGIAIVATAAGNVVLQLGDGSQITVPVAVGFNQFGFAVAKVVSQTATANSYILS